MQIEFNRKIEVGKNVDVCVIGGGPAGIAAAAAAAKQGAKVFLAEAHTCFGGMGTAGMVPAFMIFSDGVNMLASGVGSEILENLRKAGGTGPDSGLTIKPEVLKRVYDEYILSHNIDLLFQTTLIGAEYNDGVVNSAVFATKSGIFAVKAKIYIDCTGDGDLAAMTGSKFELGDENGNLMPGTLCSAWNNVDWKAYNTCGKAAREFLPKAFEDGVFRVNDPHHPGMWRIGENLAGGNIGHTFELDSTDEKSLTKALIEGRQQLLEFENFYKNYVPGFENIELISSGSLLGVRESRRIIGDYVLNLEDFIKCSNFNDEIGRYCYSVDIHISKPCKEHYARFERENKTFRYKKGESYGIPYRILTPKKLKNVLVAGRCVSSDRYIQSSIRVMPACFITGQAAGTAAALASSENLNTRQVSIKKLRKKLIEIGAYLPDKKM
jgi:FAD dependent oxidoreductase